MTDTTTLADESTASLLPPPPRPVTAHARRQSWAETNVRLWMVMAIVVLIAMAWTVARGVAEGNARRAFDARSVPARAKVLEISTLSNQKARSRSAEALYVKLLATIQNVPEPKTLVGFLPIKSGATLSVGDELDIRVDPADFNRFSDVAAAPWSEQLAIPLLLTPPLAILAAGTFLQRRAVLRLYEHGQVMPVTVVDAARAPMTPGARLVKVAPLETGAGRRVFGIVRPDRLGPVPEKGQTLSVIADPARPTRALLADAYAE